MSNINGYLDFEGLKKYHKLAGYSEIPLPYGTGLALNAATGNPINQEGPMPNLVPVTDFIMIDPGTLYTLELAGADREGVICFYDKFNGYVSGETFTGSIRFKPADKKPKSAEHDIVKMKVCDTSSTGYGLKPFTISAIHKGVIDILYDRIIKNGVTIEDVQSNISSIQGNVTSIQGNISSIQGDIKTNSNDITNIKNMVYKAHCTHSINISPTVVEIGASTPVYVTKLNFLFNNVAQSAADGVTSAKVYNINNEAIAGVSNSNINTSITQGDSAKLGTPNSTVTVNPGYEIVYNGNTFRGSYTISAVHPIYYGGGVKELITGGSDVSMTKSDLKSKFGSSALKTSASGSYKITLKLKNYIFIVSPYTISTDKVYNESTGFQFPMDSLGTLTVTGIGADAPNATYYVYRSSYEQDPGTYNMQIKS